MDLKDVAIKLKLEDNVPWTQMVDAFAAATGKRWSYDKLRAVIRRSPQYRQVEPIDNIRAVILKALGKGAAIEDLRVMTNATTRIVQATIEDLRDEGYLIDEIGGAYKLTKTVPMEESVHDSGWQGDAVIRFGVVSDPHLCSKWQQLTHLNTFYDICQREGLTDIYLVGDLTEGVNMRRGHEYETFRHGTDEQEDYVVEYYPQRTGITTSFITGNHDHSGIKHAGRDIGRGIAAKRPDMRYLGMANAKVKLTPNCTLELNHPLDGATYALSYSLQKTIDAMSGGEKPNILLNGHHHKAFQMFYRNIHAFEVGTFQAQTPWMRGKRIAAHVGGWIIDVHVESNGTIARCKGEFIPFYRAIERDY